ncbi:hypothetical protein TraAM80_01862 [Trypanosoma rangeli]|uniref:Uncharacterized protein n=1 Tax=Trypanosoma rangeli TaxID=5698 RepID=A0A422NX56_TRYRA|nr:uncharacterized protein TraAM80_01862 [Trypanosoma rangeli]RNF10113.1 hypothetical protein TraAM80_01862 [Trypanosoma rangeli]|eukprot:RNF10113.1 hypothetical protein TraAM80_01862 [Trypanosoma rangeli]
MRVSSRRWRFLLLLVALVYVICFALIQQDHGRREAINEIYQGAQYFNPVYRNTRTLIMVPGHGVLQSLNASDWKNQSNWGLESYQLRDGVALPFCFASHIRRAFVLLKDRVNSSILIFSGGQTRACAGPRSEALSYYIVAEETNLFGLFNSTSQARSILAQHVFTEEFARDSFENLLFSIARFYEITGHFPDSIIVVGWKHKRDRFVNYHREALRYPIEKFFYVGLDFDDAAPFVRDLEPYRLALPYSDVKALSFVNKDMYLCSAGRATKRQRNPHYRVSPYEVSCPPLRPLLKYCGPHLIDRKLVPWG